MKWNKLGQLFTVANSDKFLISHASNPVALHLHEDVFRIFYSGRNVENKSSVGYVDVDLILKEVVNYPKKPEFIFGQNDSFYSHGVSIGNFYAQDDQFFILFMGWQIKDDEHWFGEIGRLELRDRKNLEISSDNAFLQLDTIDPISLSYPFVIHHDGIYKMWYGSTIDWSSENGEMIHVIKYATSNDGNKWKKHGIAIPYEIGVAQAFSKPSVIIDEKGYHMWYSYRSGDGMKYRIGYSFSLNGIDWQREDENVGIDVSHSGYDSDMICYPFVFDHKNERYMLYNGNDYGRTGFGLAMLEK